MFSDEYSTHLSVSFSTLVLCSRKRRTFQPHATCHFFDALKWHGHCDIESAPGGNPETLGGTAAYRQMAPESLPSAPLIGTTSVGDAVIADDYVRKSDEALAKVNEILQKATFGGVIVALIAVGIWITEGLLG